MWLYEHTSIGSKSDTVKLMQRMDKYLKKQKYEDCKYVINEMGIAKWREIFPKSIFECSALYSFEDVLLPGPKDYDTYLKQLYGDYMSIPDIESTKWHHALEIVKL
jgi:lipopolysaccharide cholinephosphotransferase